MKKTCIPVVTPSFCTMSLVLLMVLVAVCFAGCQTSTGPRRHATNVYTDEIHRLDSADADAEVEARTKQGNWRFFAWYADEPEATTVPGLTSAEGKELIESGLFETEVYFDQRTLYVFQFEGDPKPWIDAKWRYAEKINRALVTKIRATGRISAQTTGSAPSAQPATN